MRLRQNLRLRKIGSRHMIVDTGDAVNLTNVFTLNGTAARLWQLAEAHDYTAEELAHMLCQEYDVDMATALADVQRQLDQWKEFGLTEQ